MVTYNKHGRFLSGQGWYFGVLLAIILLIGLVRFSSLGEYLNPESLKDVLISIRNNWWTPFAVILIYLVCNALFIPNMLVNATTILTLGGFYGWICAILGSLIAATSFFFVGRKFGERRVERIESSRFTKLKTILKSGGILSILIIRTIPLGPYALVNMMIGAINFNYLEFIFATFIAHCPGTILTALFGTRLEKVLVNPSLENIVLLITLFISIVGFIILFIRLTKKFNRV